MIIISSLWDKSEVMYTMRNQALQDFDLSDFGEGLRKWGFVLDWLLSETRSNPIIGYLKYLKTGKIRAKIKM